MPSGTELQVMEAFNNLGLTYRKKGMREEAIREYEEAIRILPNFKEARKNLSAIKVERRC
jgi:tetratricopeptide (TPR) repeat protein